MDTAPAPTRPEKAVDTMTQVMLCRRSVDMPLTEAEITALACLAAGDTLYAAARRLNVSERTVRRRIRTACDRLNVATPIEAVVWAAKRGLV